MTTKDARKLKAGDKVFWNDPHEGTCSKKMVISSIEVLSDGFVSLCCGRDGHIECFAQELDLIG